MASLLDPPDPDATDQSPVGTALGDLYSKVTGYMNSKPEMAFRYADNPIGTETTQSLGMPAPTTYAGAVGQYVNPSTGQLTDQGRQRMADNPLLGFDTGGVSPVSGLLGALKGYHGSPHAFDRFDNAAIGTGEGAQAYGHGMYLADSEGVARSYRDQLTPKTPFSQTVLVDGRALADIPEFQALNKRAQANVAAALGQGAGKGDWLAHINQSMDWTGAAGNISAADAEARRALYQPGLDFVQALDPSKVSVAPQPKGHMYEVNVAAEPEHFLDWDKPLSEQHPNVQKALTPEGLGLTPVGPFGPKNYYGWADAAGNRVGPLQTGKPPSVRVRPA